MSSIDQSGRPKVQSSVRRRSAGLRSAARTTLESLERRRLLTAISADFVDGAGSVLPDQYPGTADLGWSGPWTTFASNASFAPSPFVDSNLPLNDGGDHLSAGFVIPGGNSNGTVIAARGYSSTGNVATDAVHQIRFDYRVDGTLATFVDSNDKVLIFGDTAARSSQGNTTTWAIEARGTNAGSVPARTWSFQDGVSRVSSGVPLVSGTVYTFTLLLDPAAKTYVATVSDGQAGAGHTYTSGTLDFRSNSQSSSFLHFGMSGSPTGESNAFSLDSLRVTPPPPAAPASASAAAPVPSRVEITWADTSSSETGFRIQRSTDQVAWEPVGTTLPGAATTMDVALDAGVHYYYRVASVNEGGASAWVTAEVTTPATPPAARGANDPISITVVNPQQYNIVNGVVEVPRGQSLHVNAIANEVVQGDLARSDIAWDFGDYANAAAKTLNPGAQYNVLPGFNAAHVYDTLSPTGTTYKVALTIKDKTGQTWTAEQQVRVVANARDPSSRVIYVGQNGNPSGLGNLPAEPVSWERAQVRLLTLGDNSRVLFRRGDTIRAATNLDPNARKTWSFRLNNVLFSDYEDAARPSSALPVILLPASATADTSVFHSTRDATSGVSSTNVRIENLDVRAEAAGNVDGVAIQPAGRNMVLYNLTLENMRDGIKNTTSDNTVDPVTLNNGLLVMKCDTGFTGTQPVNEPKPVADYFYYAKGNEIALLGNTSGDSIYQHNTRMLFMTGSLLYDNDLSNPKSQSNGDFNTLRFNEGRYAWWGRNTLRGGGMTVGRYVGAPAEWLMRNVVIERNKQLVTWATAAGSFTDTVRDSSLERLMVGENAAHVVVRNNYLESYDQPVMRVTVNASDVQIASNTGVTSGPEHKGAFLETNAGVSLVILRNNLYLAPDVVANTGGTGYAVNSANGNLGEFSDIGGNFWSVTATPRTSSVFRAGASAFGLATWNGKSVVGTDFPDPAGTFAGAVTLDSSYRPTSDVVEVAGQFPASGIFTDITGALRPQSGAWTAGAVERNPAGAAEYNGLDIGAQASGGSTSPVAGGYNLVAASHDISGTGDSFHFGYKHLSGDFDLKVQVTAMTGQSVHATAKAGLMVRASAASNSMHVMAAVTPSGFKFVHRDSTGAGTSIDTTGTVTFPNAWVRLKRAGSLFVAYYSTNGDDWTDFGRVSLPAMPSTDALFGMAAASNNSGSQTLAAQFRNLADGAGSFGNLTIKRFTGADTLSLGTSGSDLTTVVNSLSLSYPVASFASVLLDTDGGDDTVEVNIPSTVAVRFKGGTGNDALNVTGGSYSFAGDARDDTSSLALNVSGGSVSLGDSQHLRSLTLSAGTVTMPTGGGKVLVTSALTLSGSGKLDLRDQDLILDYSGASPLGTWTGTGYTGATGWIASGRNGGDWGGSGIVTGMSDANPSNHLTTLGVAEASRALGLSGTQTALWNGQTVDATTVLIKYTYGGDVDLNGRINGDDYAIMNAATASMHSYAEGDLDYSGSVASGDDWFIIDSNIGRQGAPL